MAFKIAYVYDYYKAMQAASRRHKKKITKMQLFATSDKVMPYIESTRGLNLAAVRLTTAQMTKQQLWSRLE